MTGAAESLAWRLAMLRDGQRPWRQCDGLEGILRQMGGRHPQRAPLAAVTLADLGIALTSETRYREVLAAAARRGLGHCEYGVVPLAVTAGVRLAPRGCPRADAYARVVICTRPISHDAPRLFAFRGKPAGLCVSACYGADDTRLIEMFSDEGFAFVPQLPDARPAEDVAFLFSLAPTETVPDAIHDGSPARALAATSLESVRPFATMDVRIPIAA